MKSKSIVSIVLVSMLAATFMAIPNAFAAYSLTVNNAYCQTHNVSVSITFYFGGTVTDPAGPDPAQHTGATAYTTPATITGLVASTWYYISIPAVIVHDGKVCAAKTRWETIAGAGWQYNFKTAGMRGTVPVMIYEVHRPSDAATTVRPLYGRAGPKIDVFRAKVIKSPDAALTAMQTGAADVSTDLIRTGDVEKLRTDGHTVTYDPGFHMGHIGYNIRPLAIQQLRRPELVNWPLADVKFRHALIHCYDQETIVASIYGYTVTPVRSLVPPSQGGWVSTAIPTHPYNPGIISFDPANPNYMKLNFTAVHSSVKILVDAGYTFVDADGDSRADPEDYWKVPAAAGGLAIPRMKMWTPTYETAPTSAEHGARFVADLAEIGLAATAGNGYKGIEHVPTEFSPYVEDVKKGLFDLYMVFWSLGRFPDHLYDMCHSSQDSWTYNGRYNHPGINDASIDSYVTVVKTSLNHTDKLIKAKLAQNRLYDVSCSSAIAYMQLYSRIYFNGFNKDLLGVVKSPGYGSDNGYTYLNIHWAPGKERVTEVDHPHPGLTLLKWIWGEDPETLNPCQASTVYAWDIMGKTIDGLLDVNPYTHEDLLGMSSAKPDIVLTPGGPGAMEITYHLRKDVFWQDGNIFDAWDAKFNWEFIKNNQIPRYTSTWQYIQSVVVIDDYTVKVVLNAASQFLVYDLAGLACLLPPPVWKWLDGKPQLTILQYDPSKNYTAPWGAGPWFGTYPYTQTQLYGTGPFVFDYYSKTTMIGELHQFPAYYRITEDIQTDKANWFHQVGDCASATQGVGYSDGILWSEDRGQMGMRYGRYYGEALYHQYVDVSAWIGGVYIEDPSNIIDVVDLSLANFHFGEQREYPTP